LPDDPRLGLPTHVQMRDETARTSQILRNLESSGQNPVEVGVLVAALGSRMHGVALLLLAMPDALPLPIPSLSAILGLPLVLTASHVVLHGEEPRLPARVERLRIPPGTIHILVRYAAALIAALERLSRPRFQIVLRSERVLGLICRYLSVLLLLPIPLMNAWPALCLVAIALGMIQRDGLMVSVGIIGTLMLTVALGFLGEWVKGLFN
jgi:hypothetical protein